MKAFYKTLLSVALIASFAAACNNTQSKEDASSVTDTVAVAVSPDDTVPPAVKFDFNSMKADTLVAFKGGDGEVYMKSVADGQTKIMLCTVPMGASVGFHRHDANMEVIRIVKGTARIILDQEEQMYEEGMVHYCPMGHGHSIHNAGEGDLIIFNVVSLQ